MASAIWTTAWTVWKATRKPLSGSWIAHVFGPKSICGQRRSSSGRASRSWATPSRCNVASVFVVSGSSPRAIQSTPTSWNSAGRPIWPKSDFQSSRERIDQRV